MQFIAEMNILMPGYISLEYLEDYLIAFSLG